MFVLWYDKTPFYGSAKTLIPRPLAQDIWEGYNDFILTPYRQQYYKKRYKPDITIKFIRKKFLEFLTECELPREWSLELHKGDFVDCRVSMAWYIWMAAHNHLFRKF